MGCVCSGSAAVMSFIKVKEATEERLHLLHEPSQRSWGIFAGGSCQISHETPVKEVVSSVSWQFSKTYIFIF